MRPLKKKIEQPIPFPPREDGLPLWWTQLEIDAETCPHTSRVRGHSHGIRLRNHDGISVRKCASDWKQRTKGGKRIQTT